MREKEFKTVGEYFYWRYSNMAMAHIALKNSHKKYERLDYMIRAKMYKQLCDGNMNISTLYDDEKCKMNNINCCYCGCTEKLTLDHLIPRYSGDNIVYSCKSCNCSKNKNDLLVWYTNKDEFPPILVLRRYLKLAFMHFKDTAVFDLPISEIDNYTDIFRLNLLPYRFPQPAYLRL